MRSLTPGQLDQCASAALTRRYGADDVLLCRSGTEALQIALGIASRCTDGNAIVAAPAYTCYDVASAIIGADMQARLYDVDPATLAPDLESLEATLRDGARIIVVTPLYGHPLNYQSVVECARRYAAIVVEDAAQGHGAWWRGRPLGSHGDIATLSFGRGKGWTSGAGGAVLLHRSGADRERLHLPATGSGFGVVLTALAAAVLGRPGAYAIPRSMSFLHLGETVYHSPRVPAHMTRFAAALLAETEAPSDREAERRSRTAAWYRSELTGVAAVFCPPPVEEGVSGCLRFPILLQRGTPALATTKRAIRLGIAPGYPLPLNQLPQLRSRLSASQLSCPGAEELAERLVTLPTHSRLRDAERVAVVDWVRQRPAASRPSFERIRSIPVRTSAASPLEDT